MNNTAYLELLGIIKKWLYIVDDGLVKVIAASIIANQLPGDPFWLLIVAPSGGAKTELLRGLEDLENVHFISDVTPQALLSGYKTDDAGLLDRIGPFGIVIMKDFTTVLEMNREKRGEVMAQLREIYDGFASKSFGNGKTASWRGKLGFLGAVTTVIDQHLNVYQTLGERFVQYRPTQPDRLDVARRAMMNHGQETQMREEIRAAFAKFITKMNIPKEPIHLPPEYLERIINLSAFCSTARSGVMREGRGSQDIIFVPEAEMPTRLAKQLAMLMYSLSRISGDFNETDYRLIYKIGLDNLTSLRRNLIHCLLDASKPLSINEITTAIHLPQNTVRKRLEDLAALKIVETDTPGNGLPYFYQLSGETAELLLAAQPPDQSMRDKVSKIFFNDKGVPEMSGR